MFLILVFTTSLTAAQVIIQNGSHLVQENQNGVQNFSQILDDSIFVTEEPQFHRLLLHKGIDPMDQDKKYRSHFTNFLNTQFLHDETPEIASKDGGKEHRRRKPKLRPSKTTKFRHSTKVSTPPDELPPRNPTTTTTSTTTTSTTTTTTEAPTTKASIVERERIEESRWPVVAIQTSAAPEIWENEVENEPQKLQPRTAGSRTKNEGIHRKSAAIQFFCTKICP